MSKYHALIVAMLPVAAACASEEPKSEAVRVVSEACGTAPAATCLTELRKVCHAHPSFRCYYSFKARLDAVRNTGFSRTSDQEAEE